MTAMYVLKQDVTAYSSGQLIPSGTPLHSIYSDATDKDGDGILAIASVAGERHRLAFKKDAMEWVNPPGID